MSIKLRQGDLGSREPIAPGQVSFAQSMDSGWRRIVLE